MEEKITNAKLDFLSGGGKMGELIRAKDWSKTPLGSPATWPQSLRTTVNLCIASNFAIAIIWGPHRVQIYNDGYWPITGDMHPTSMGQDFAACWQSAWPVIGKAFEEAILGNTRFLENQRIFLDRYGYKEETFFTFSFSPILDESGAVGGLFHPVIELTQQILSERRLNILHTVANHTVNARTAEEASALILNCLKDFALDIPFVLLYSIAADGKQANLDGSVGIEGDSPLAPANINLEEHALKSWPFTEVIQNGKALLVEKLANIFGTFNCGPYPEPPEQALVFPVILPGAAHNNYFLVAGVSSRRSLDEKYLLFYELLAASVTNELAKARVYEEERKKAEALAEIDKAKTVFFSNISHEFRTPLTLMLSPLEELLNQKKNNFSKSEKQNIEITHRNAIRLLKLVNTLLDFSRIESGRQQGVFSLVDIVSLTKNLASNFRSIIEKAGLKLIVNADSIIKPVYVDKQMWEKIVFNLLSNAFKYTLEGKITVELSAEKDFAVLKVKDTGVGISENELPKMFERFHRVQNVTGRTFEGTGIGLSLIKELVQMHHGTIGVESKLNNGSVFTVKIPFGKEHLDGHQISKTAIDSDEISANIYVEEIETLLKTDKKEVLKISSVKEKNILPTVLVVDDNADMREHISSILSNNFNVITANNGMDALHKMKETIPALVLSDIMMPVMDGIGLLKEIKSNKATSNIPVIFLTARAGEESRIEGLETGADDYLVKPFSSKELLSRVKAQIKIIKLRNELEGNVRNLFLEAPAIICVLRGPLHVYELANEMYLKLVGNRDILGKPIRKALPELEETGIYELLDHVYSIGEPFIGNEMPVKLDKGNGKLEEIYINFVYQPSRNSEGEIDGILVYGVDVSEQVLARKKIEESEKRFRSLAQTLPQLVWVTDAQGNPEFASERWKTYSGFESRGEKEWKALVHPDDYDNINAAWVHSLRTGDMYTADVRLKNKDGQYKWHAVIGEPVLDKDNKIVKWVGAFTDIHEQKEAIETLKESEKQFSTLANNIQNLTWIADSEGYIFWYNERWYDYTGTTLEEMKGWGWEKVHHPDHIERVVNFVKKAWKKNEPYEMTFPLRGADGKYRWFLTRVFPVNDVEGKILRWVGTNTDIEDQKIKEERKDEFISIASHELKTPLTTVKGYLQLLELSLDVNNEDANLYVKKASQSINRLNELISELLDVSKIRLGKLNYTISTFNFNDMVDSTVENIQLTSPTHTIIKTGKVYGDVTGDKNRLEQVVINLLNNAIKYSPGASEVLINVEQENDKIKVSVKDTGIGMSKGSLNQIFEKYHRIEEHAQHFQGLGIGLYISYEIIQRHNGKLWVESEPGKGSIFYFTLPLRYNESAQ